MDRTLSPYRSGSPSLALLLAFSLAAAPAPVAGESRPKPPNVVLVLADDLGYADIGAFGARSIRTPQIDRLAREGVRFTDFYVAQAACSASRAALLTGAYSNRVGILGALFPSAKLGIADAETTLAEVLKARGYATRSTASGTSATCRRSCRRATASTTTSACPTRTTCGRGTRSSAASRRCRSTRATRC